MILSEVVDAKCIGVQTPLADKDSALHEIARLAMNSPILSGTVTEDQIFQGMREREELGSTGFGDGIAIPHCRLPEVPSFVVGMVSVPDGVEFGALDEEPVKLIVFIVGPESDSKEHVRILSGVSQVLAIPGATKEMISEPTSRAMLESFLRHVKDEVDTHQHDTKNLALLFIQEEELFQDLLKIFTSTEPCSFVVLESHNASEYLASMPLFAGFWSDSHIGFSRTIVASIEQKLTNEMIRQIERVTGNLDERTDVMLLVQKVFYASGSLGE